VREKAHGTYTYWRARGDFAISHGRNAIDVYEVTLDAPPKPFGQGGDDGDDGDRDMDDDGDEDADDNRDGDDYREGSISAVWERLNDVAA
jgi:hypothetical protein